MKGFSREIEEILEIITDPKISIYNPPCLQ